MAKDSIAQFNTYQNHADKTFTKEQMHKKTYNQVSNMAKKDLKSKGIVVERNGKKSKVKSGNKGK